MGRGSCGHCSGQELLLVVIGLIPASNSINYLDSIIVSGRD
jgi:hypothetical protein